MRRQLGILASAMLLAACGAPVTNEFVGNPNLGHRMTVATLDDQLIVKYNTPAFKTKGIELLYRMPGTVVLDSFQSEVGLTELQRVPAGIKAADAVSRYEADSTVAAVMPNQTWRVYDGAPTPVDDPLLAQQWHVQTLRLPEVWSRSQGEGVTVAVIDSGVDTSHPDLSGQIAPGGYDFVDKDADPKDMNGHGTHVAGIIAARIANGEGVSGIAPKAKIMPIRVLDAEGRGNAFVILKAMSHAVKKGAKVVNLSLGSPPGGLLKQLYLKLFGDSLTRKGALLVAAAGNDGGPVGAPAQVSAFMAVSATNATDKLASFSNSGKPISVAAPGVDIWSTMPTYACYMTEKYPEKMSRNYSAMSGTSMATPLVAGTAALIWALHPEWKPAQVRAEIEKSALDLGQGGRDPLYGFGRIRPLVAVGGPV